MRKLTINQDVYSIYILLKIAVAFCSKPCSQNTQECHQPPQKKRGWQGKEQLRWWRHLALDFTVLGSWLAGVVELALGWIAHHPAITSKITTCLGSGIPRETFIYATGRGKNIPDEDENGGETNVLLLVEVVNSAIAQYCKGVFWGGGSNIRLDDGHV